MKTRGNTRTRVPRGSIPLFRLSARGGKPGKQSWAPAFVLRRPGTKHGPFGPLTAACCSKSITSLEPRHERMSARSLGRIANGSSDQTGFHWPWTDGRSDGGASACLRRGTACVRHVPPALAPFIKAGAITHTSPRSVADSASIVFASLPTQSVSEKGALVPAASPTVRPSKSTSRCRRSAWTLSS